MTFKTSSNSIQFNSLPL